MSSLFFNCKVNKSCKINKFVFGFILINVISVTFIMYLKSSICNLNMLFKPVINFCSIVFLLFHIFFRYWPCYFEKNILWACILFCKLSSYLLVLVYFMIIKNLFVDYCITNNNTFFRCISKPSYILED